VTQKEQLAEAQTRITELEQQGVTAAEVIAKQDSAISELTVKLTTAETKVSEQESEISNLNKVLETLTESAEISETEIDRLEAEQLKALAEIAELKQSAKSVEELADTRAREIAARNGATLPPKQPGAGDKTIEGNVTAGLRGMARAIAYLTSRQPTPLTV
jgi:chromosome segregation ATPase